MGPQVSHNQMGQVWQGGLQQTTSNIQTGILAGTDPNALKAINQPIKHGAKFGLGNNAFSQP
jgi:hypothetical protein